MKRLLPLLLVAVLPLAACGRKATTTTLIRNPDGTCALEIYKERPAEADETETYLIPCPATQVTTTTNG